MSFRDGVRMGGGSTLPAAIPTATNVITAVPVMPEARLYRFLIRDPSDRSGYI